MFSFSFRRAMAVFVAALTLHVGGAAAAEPIRIGAILSVSGPGSLLGDPEAKVLKRYVKRINGEGGVLGRKVELIVYDDESKAANSAAFAKRLIFNDKVDVILGPSLTGNTMAVVPEVQEAKVPMISLAGGGVIVEPVKRWVFKTPHTDKMATEQVFNDMKRRGIRQIALIYGTDGYGLSASKATKELASTMGMTIAADETYVPNDVDMTTQLAKIKANPKVQAVFNLGFGRAAAIVTKDYRELGITLPFYESHGVNSRSYIDLAGVDATEGVRLPGSALLVADAVPADDPQKATIMAFKKDFETAFKTEVSTYGGYAYDALQITLAAIQRAGSTDKEKVRDEIEKTSGYIGTTGIVHMSPEDHLGLDQAALRMVEIRKGQWKLVN